MTSQQLPHREDPSAPIRTRRCLLFLLTLRGLRRSQSPLVVPPEAAHRTVDPPRLGSESTVNTVPIRLGETRTLPSGNLNGSCTPARRPASLTPCRSTPSEMTCPKSSPRSSDSKSSQGNSSNGNNPTEDEPATRPSPSRSRSSRLLTSPSSTSRLKRKGNKGGTRYNDDKAG